MYALAFLRFKANVRQSLLTCYLTGGTGGPVQRLLPSVGDSKHIAQASVGLGFPPARAPPSSNYRWSHPLSDSHAPAALRPPSGAAYPAQP